MRCLLQFSLYTRYGSNSIFPSTEFVAKSIFREYRMRLIAYVVPGKLDVRNRRFVCLTKWRARDIQQNGVLNIVQ